MAENLKTVGAGLNGIMSFQEKIALKEFCCKTHGTYSGRTSTVVFLGKVRELDPPCPMCDAEEKALAAEAGERRKRQAETEIEQKRIERLKEMNIGEKFWNESFETFDAYTDELKRHLKTCVEFAENHQGRMLVMLGNHGNGKDHLAASVLKKTGGYMYSVFEIELLLKQSYAGRISEWDIYERLCREPMLVINEIGRHKSGKWEMDFMSHIINKRYENMKPLILISNKHLMDDCPNGGCEDCLQGFIGNDVISRITEGGEIMQFTGEDYRQKKRVLRMDKEGNK